MLVTGSNAPLNKGISIRIAKDGYSFSTPSGWQSFKLPPVSVANELDKALERLARKIKDYADVTLLADYPSTRVPLDEFRSEQAQSYYRLVFGLDSLQGLTIKYKVISNIDVVEIFPIDIELCDIVFRHFPLATINGFYAQSLHDFFRYHKMHNDGRRRLYASVEGSSLLLCTFSGHNLDFANTFDDDETANRLYFILSVWQQLHLDQEGDALVFTGKNDVLLAELRKYIRHIE